MSEMMKKLRILRDIMYNSTKFNILMLYAYIYSRKFQNKNKYGFLFYKKNLNVIY